MHDHRGAEVVAGLCDPQTNLTAEYFQPGATYTSQQFQEWYGQPLYADWIKKAKGDKTYWDVVKVHL